MNEDIKKYWVTEEVFAAHRHNIDCSKNEIVFPYEFVIAKVTELEQAYEIIKNLSHHINKELCECGKVAQWIYMPGSSQYYCDNCVSRGCNCNHEHVYNNDLQEESADITTNLPTEDDIPFKWIEDGKKWTRVDSQGREYPCVEYVYCEDGFEKEEYDNNEEKNHNT